MNDADNIDFKKYALETKPQISVIWDATPPPGVGFQTHKFSIIDAIENLSVVLRTDPSEQIEQLTVGFNTARILAILPMFVCATATNGLLPKKDKHALLGSIGRREVLLDTSKWMDNYMLLTNGTEQLAWLQLVNLK